MTKSAGLMKLTKKLESEIRKAYLTYWESYFTGDLKTFSSIIDDSYAMIGTSEGEVINGKKETTRWLKASVKEIKGKAEFRSRKIKISLIEELAFVHEQANAFILANNKWQFYSKIRISTFLSNATGSWKVVQQHGSLPDGRTEEGETVSFESLTQENLQLRDAVKRRTTELELQNQELEIQTSLERVRAVAMSMHKPEDLATICKVLYHELRDLGFEEMRNTQINIHDNDNKKLLNYDYIPERGSNATNFNYTSHPLIKNLVKQLQKGNDFSSFTIGPNRLKEWRALRKKSGEKEDAQLKKATSLYYYFYSIGNGAIGLSAIKKLSTTKLDLLKRFRNVFDLAYRRYEDIKKAQAQVYEAQIEAALEKVRSKSLAMHKSDELANLSLELVQQVQALGIATWFCAFNIYDDHELGSLEWGSNGEGVFPKYRTPREGIFLRYYDRGQQGESLLVNEIDEDECPAHYDYLCSLPGVGDQLLKMKAAGIAFPTYQIDHVGYFKYGYIIYITYKPVPEAHEIFKRFAKVFEQTYTRFLDLQKAEAQAREARIEAALERVRSQSMAMHKSEDLLKVINTVSEQLQQLGVKFHNTSFGINSEGNDYSFWMASPHQPHPYKLDIPYLANPMSDRVIEAKKNKKDFFADELSKKDNLRWHEHIIQHAGDNVFSEEVKSFVLSRKGYARSTVFMKNIFLTVGNYVPKPYLESENEIFRRFAKVFDQSYTRFLDLQKAEVQAREAQIEAALERVRSRSMAMHKSDELLEVVSVVSEQLQQLEIRFDSVSFVINNNDKSYKFWVATRGLPNPVFLDVPYIDIPMFMQLQAAQEQRLKFYTDVLDQKENKRWQEHMFKHVNEDLFSDEAKEYVISRGLARSVAIFPNIMLILSNFASVAYSESDNDIITRFGQVFDQTYTRFLDLQKAELLALKAEQDLIEIKVAREKAEAALAELQLTQKQLIQSEKMASLGELTAGIAHEIQNPLNFVNNFSEVSTELVDEMKSEIDAGNSEEAKEIAADLKENLQKINHHGKRAGDIVKGMLQHSRSSGGQKELTDINALADEYLRLAYHGLRAKDKSFNASMKMEFDDTIQKLNVVPQDIGRVVLNLITNAFYVVAEKKKGQPDGYEPTVTVSTKKEDNQVLISVKDNGNGIPDAIKEKIFQPFFTTKPTGSGTGLGLSLSYDIVKAHGGELKVETSEGGGSEFMIQLPIV